MIILGVETSCDETALAVVEDGKLIRSNTVVSSLKEHKKYGGIIPEIASRRQLQCIHSVAQQALDDANVTLDDIDAIAVTVKPGLMGSLLVGISFSRALAVALNKPLIEVDHIKAHVYANFLRKPGDDRPLPKLPAVGLVVSGGHTSLFHIKEFNTFALLGQTRDDAAGEAFDKVARILDLGYPGGPAIEKSALTAKKSDLQFTCAQLPDTLDFSFSGIKTAVLYHKRDHSDQPDFSVSQVARAFQDSVTHVLVKKCMMACQQLHCQTLLVGGGVSANKYLREQLMGEAERHQIDVHFPSMDLCLDNAAMIAGLGFHEQLQNV